MIFQSLSISFILLPIIFMGYNQNCTYQSCSWKCCNYHGDCPDWYSNGNAEYTNCYYYYKVDQSTLIATAVGTAIGILILTIIACVWYRMYKKKQEELLKQEGFEISNATLETKPDVMVVNPSKPPIVFAAIQEYNQQIYKKNTVDPFNTTQMTRVTNQIYGIGAHYQKQI